MKLHVLQQHIADYDKIFFAVRFDNFVEENLPQKHCFIST